MKQIHIETSTYGKNGNRLVVSELDEKGNGGGTRIVGAKFNDFSSNKEISVPLTVSQAKTLVEELQKAIIRIQIISESEAQE